MAELKTKKNEGDINAFINTIEDESKRDDSWTIINMMKELTGDEPKMWGPSIIGFLDIHYKSAAGSEGDWFRLGFSPRKQNLTLYIMSGFNGLEEKLSRLGKHKLGKGCLYIKKLEHIDLAVLKEIIEASLKSIDDNDAILCGC